MQRKEVWLDPGIQLLIAVDKKLAKNKYTEAEFHLLFDETVDQINARTPIDYVLAAQLKHKIIDSARKKVSTDPFDKLSPNTHRTLVFSNIILQQHLQKIFYLYLENVDEAALKYRFLSKLYYYITNKGALNTCVQSRAAVKNQAEEKLNLKQVKAAFAESTSLTPESLDIQVPRIEAELESYTNEGYQGLTSIVHDAVLFSADADTSKHLIKIMASMNDAFADGSEEAQDYITYRSKRIPDYLQPLSAEICSAICAETFHEIATMHMMYDEKDDSFNQHFVDAVQKTKQKYSAFKDAAFQNEEYVFQTEYRRLKTWIDNPSVDDNILRLKCISAPLGPVCQDIYSMIPNIKNTVGNGVSTHDLTQDLLTINRALTTPKLAPLQLQRLQAQSNQNQAAGGKRKLLGIAMATLGFGLMVLSGIIISGTWGLGLIPGLGIGAVGFGLFSAGLGLLNHAKQRNELGEKEEQVEKILAHRPGHLRPV